jgi:hypothetical protein
MKIVKNLLGFSKTNVISQTLQILNINFVVYYCANKLLATILLSFMGPLDIFVGQVNYNFELFQKKNYK